MRQLRREKEVKEAARREELSKKGTDSMNQEDSTKATELRQKRQKMLKEMLKKVALKKATEEKGAQQRANEDHKKEEGGEEEKPIDKEKNNEKESRTKKAATGIKNKTRPQGARVTPEATDGHGCDHKGLLDLKILPSDYLRNYMKVGGCLWNVPCRHCAKGRQGSHNKRNELDLSSRMPKKGKETWYITVTVGQLDMRWRTTTRTRQCILVI
jgi:hypothetical protein